MLKALRFCLSDFMKGKEMKFIFNLNNDDFHQFLLGKSD
jgi:hypothetical protein